MRRKVVSMWLVLTMLLSMGGSAYAAMMPEDSMPQLPEGIVQEAVGQSIEEQSLSGQSIEEQSLSSQSLAGQSLSGQSLAGQSLAGQSLAGQSLEELSSQEQSTQESNPESQNGMPRQLTEEDIAEMNGGNVLITYNDEGYVSTIVGKYYEGVVQDYEDAVESIKGIAVLLGLGLGSEFFAVSGSKDGNGYTYWTFQQRYGMQTLQFATLRVIVDPEGYTAGVSSSFIPNVGIAEETVSITPQEAEQVVLQTYSQQNLRVMSEYTQRVAVQFYNVVFNCYAVYTNNPDMTASFNMPYYEHYVTVNGEYVNRIATNTLSTSNEQALYKADQYFEGLEQTSYQGTVRAGDGTVKQIEVPVAYNPEDGVYYLADLKRKIMVGQYYDICFKNELNFVTSKTNSGWSDNNLLAYYNYCLAYDFYEEHGMTSVDDYGTPILVAVGYCDEEGNPVDNACYFGNNLGWVCFGVSDINTYSDALDVCGHEFTHAVTRNSAQGTVYMNEYGAINESYSDILGNLCELMMGETEDKNWLVGERSGEAMRNMSDPNSYDQPSFVGDMYYVPPVQNPQIAVNDNGGVHINNSLLGHLAYQLDQAGMDREDQVKLWLGTVAMITPYSDYDDLHALLLLSGEINQIDGQYLKLVNEQFAKLGLDGDRSENARNAERSGYGKIHLKVDETIAGTPCVCYLVDTNFRIVTYSCPDQNGDVYALVPQGVYGVIFECMDEEGTREMVGHASYGWVSKDNCQAISVENGAVVELNALTAGHFPQLKLPRKDTSENKPSKQPDQEPEQPGEPGELSFIAYSADNLFMMVPEGWTVENYGEYYCPAVKIYNPQDPGVELFFFSYLSPLFHDENERMVHSMYDYTGLYKYAPILRQSDAAGILYAWEEITAFQIMAEQRELFPQLRNVQPYATANYYSLYAQYMGTNDSAGAAACITESGENGTVLFASSILGNQMGVTVPYTLLSSVGVVGSEEQLSLYLEGLLECLKTLTFTDTSLQMSRQYAYFALPNAAEMNAVTASITDALWSLYAQ